MSRLLSVVVVVAILLGCLPVQPATYAEPSEPVLPTVFLHGWRGNSLTFAPFFKQAKQQRPDQQVIKIKVFYSGNVKVTRPKVVQEDVYIEVILAGTSIQTIGLKRQLNLFKRAMKEVQALTGSEQVNIVSHSMGGVVATTYILQQAKHSNKQGLPTVNRLVTLDAPIHGTHLGNVYEKFGKFVVVNAVNPINLVVQGYNVALRMCMPEGQKDKYAIRLDPALFDLRQGSDEMNRIAADLKAGLFPAEIKVFSASAKFDSTVPNKSAFYLTQFTDHAVKESFDLTHHDMDRDERLVERVLQFIHP